MKISARISAVVSGGASGLGAAVVKKLSNLGVNVSILDLDEDKGLHLAAKTNSYFVKTDIANYHSVSRALARAREKFGFERICVNCAGIAPAEKTISKKTGAHNNKLFERVISVNLNGTFNLGSQVALGMAALSSVNESGERGVIINTTSIAGYEGQIGQLAYSASKAGVLGMVLPMARDLADHGIRVMGIAPGIFSTPMVDGLPEDVQSKLGAAIPFPSRLGDPQEFAQLVVQIIENTMLNGEVIRLDGAIRLAPR